MKGRKRKRRQTSSRQAQRLVLWESRFAARVHGVSGLGDDMRTVQPGALQVPKEKKNALLAGELKLMGTRARKGVDRRGCTSVFMLGVHSDTLHDSADDAVHSLCCCCLTVFTLV